MPKSVSRVAAEVRAFAAARSLMIASAGQTGDSSCSSYFARLWQSSWRFHYCCLWRLRRCQSNRDGAT